MLGLCYSLEVHKHAMEDSVVLPTRSFLMENNTDDLFQNISSTDLPSSTPVNRITYNSVISKFFPIIVTEMALSIICLSLSIIVYCILPEFQNVHGKNLISLSTCLLTTFLLLCIDIVFNLHISYTFCYVIAISIHVTFLATFFWTNIMAFDIWSNITSMKAKNEIKSRTSRYFKYSIYAWTATILTALPAVILESTEFVPLDYRPQFGLKRCWLSGKTAFTYYFSFPVGVILLGNLFMFIMTVWKLWKIKKVTSVLQMKHHHQRLNLYLKLFFAMGIIWIAELLPWATKIYKLYVLASMLMALHGVLLFAIFILNKRILRQVWKKLSGKNLKKSTTRQRMSRLAARNQEPLM